MIIFLPSPSPCHYFIFILKWHGKIEKIMRGCLRIMSTTFDIFRMICWESLFSNKICFLWLTSKSQQWWRHTQIIVLLKMSFVARITRKMTWIYSRSSRTWWLGAEERATSVKRHELFIIMQKREKCAFLLWEPFRLCHTLQQGSEVIYLQRNCAFATIIVKF